MSAETRIVGGDFAPSGKYPWFVASTGNYFCGASLISEDVLLTAAHCAAAFTKGTGVYVGANFRDSSYGGAEYFTLDEVYPHPEYNENNLENDFMLLKLSGSSTKTPVELNTNPTFPEPGNVLTTMGFGRTSEDGSVSYSLKEVDIESIDNQVCVAQYEGVTGVDGTTPLEFDTDIMMCAGVPEGGKSACNGDSGGPLVSEDGKQVGVVSFGVGCARPDFYGVYARVSGVSDWIKQGICDLSANPPTDCTSGTNDESSDGTGNDNDNDTGNVSDGSSAKVRVLFAYDFFVDETLWTISQGDNIIYYGPKYQPGPYEAWNTTFEEFPAGDYTFTVYDSECDGLQSAFGSGSYKILMLNGEDETVLASGDADFDCSRATPFSVSGSGKLEETKIPPCKDGQGAIEVTDTQTEDCAWLADNMNEFDFLCDWEDIALACPLTCGSCPETAALDCLDKDEAVYMDITVGEKKCSWLADNMNRYGYVCDRSEVAFHCPATCGTASC